MKSAYLTERGIIVFVGIEYPRCALALNSATDQKELIINHLSAITISTAWVITFLK